MAERCLTLGCPEAIRLAKQDACSGEKVVGEGNGYVLSCIRNWSIEPITREGEASEYISDCGAVVVREKQDDQLIGYTISFETVTRSNELEALVTDSILIPDDDLNIGSYKVASSASCNSSESSDSRFIIEAFYKLSRCVTGADHVRVVLPMAQFKVTELDREGTVTYYRYTAETGVTYATALAAGPYDDFPVDVSTFLAARDPDELTTGFDFEEEVTITGSCGTIEVPNPITITGVEGDCPEGTITITGTGLDQVLGFFEVNLDVCDVLRGHISTSECEGGTPLALAESATSVTIDGPVDCGPCNVTSISIYDENCELISTTEFDPEVSICCPPGFTEFPVAAAMVAGAIAEQEDGSYLGFAMTSVGGANTARLYRVDDAGIPDATFGTAGVVQVATGLDSTDLVGGVIERASDNTIYVSYDAGGTDVAVAKFNSLGVPVAAFGTAGVATIADALVTSRSIFVRSDGDIVVLTYSDQSTTPVARLTRLNGTTGAVVDTQDFTPSLNPVGAAQSSDSVYYVYLDDDADSDFFIAEADLVANTVNEVSLATDLKPGAFVNPPNVGVNLDEDGNIFVSGKNTAGTSVLVAKIDPTLTLDATFGTGGILTYSASPTGQEEGVDALPLTTGNVHTSGVAFDDTNTFRQQVTALFDATGTPVGSHGVAGISELATGPDGNSGIVDSIAVESINAVVHFGWTLDGVNGRQPMFSRTLITTGALDSTFGEL